MAIKFSNNARSGLAANILATDTSITVADASVFPALVPGDVLYLTIANITNTLNEIIKCTAITGNTLTVSRGEEGTTPRDWTTNDNVSSRLTTELLETITARAYNSIDTTDDVVFNSTTVNSVQLVGGTDTQGTLSWNIEEETVDLIVSPNVTYQLGQELGIVARNLSGTTLVNGQVVKVTGASGDKITVDLADSTTEQDSSTTFAIVTEDIVNNSTGHITTNGLVRGLDTSTFVEGVAIWLGSNGAFTATKPLSPEHLVHIGWVVRSHATEGSILVRISNGWELDELHDVLITSITDNEILQWNAASSLWENQTLAEAGIATAAQGALADSAIQPGDNVSTLTNDAGYLTSIGDSALTELSDVYSSMSPTDGQVLTWDNTNSRWDAADATGGGGGVSLGTVSGTGTATVDLSSGTVFDYTVNEDTTFVFSNPSQAEKFDLITTVNHTTTSDYYGIANLTSRESTYTGIPNAANGHLCYSADGTKLFRINSYMSADSLSLYIEVETHVLNTAYAPTSSSSSTTLVHTVAIAPADSAAPDNNFYISKRPTVTVSADGTKALIGVGYVRLISSTYYFSRSIYEFSLSTANDFTTASLVDSYAVYTDTTTLFTTGGEIYDDLGTSVYYLDAGLRLALPSAYDLTGITLDSTGGSNSGIYSVTRTTGNELLVNKSASLEIYTAADNNWHNMVTTGETYEPATYTLLAQFYNSGADLSVVDSSMDVSSYSTETLTVPTLTFPASVEWLSGVSSAYTDGEQVQFKFVTPDSGTTYYGVQELASAAPATSVNIVSFTSSGTYTPPANLAYAEVILTGGGGGGGGADTDGSGYSGGGGGASGNTIITALSKADLGSSVSITIGSGGSGGAVTGTSGSTGGSTIVATSIETFTAEGGYGGGGSYTTGYYGGAGGSSNYQNAPTNGLLVRGGDGGDGGSYTSVESGYGAASYWGGGGGSQYDNLGSQYGKNGVAYGSGGSGACTANSTSGGAGGTGATGIVVIKEYLK